MGNGETGNGTTKMGEQRMGKYEYEYEKGKNGFDNSDGAMGMRVW